MGGLRIRIGAQAPTPISLAVARATLALTGRGIGLAVVDNQLSALDWSGGDGSGLRRMPARTLGTGAGRGSEFPLYPSTNLWRGFCYQKVASGGNGTTSRTVPGTHYMCGVNRSNSFPDGGNWDTMPGSPNNGNPIFQWASNDTAPWYALEQPFPSPANTSNTQYEEVSCDQNDFITRDGGGNAVPNYGHWAAHVARHLNNGGNSYTHQHYYNLLNSLADVITVTFNDSNWAAFGEPPHPAICIAQTPYNTYPDNNEEFCGAMRGFQFFKVDISDTGDLADLSSVETDADALSLISALGLTSSLYFLSINPKLESGNIFTDHSNNGNHFTWIGPDRPDQIVFVP